MAIESAVEIGEQKSELGWRDWTLNRIGLAKEPIHFWAFLIAFSCKAHAFLDKTLLVKFCNERERERGVINLRETKY